MKMPNVTKEYTNAYLVSHDRRVGDWIGPPELIVVYADSTEEALETLKKRVKKNTLLDDDDIESIFNTSVKITHYIPDQRKSMRGKVDPYE